MTDERDEAREAAIAYLREHRITAELRAADARRQRMLFLAGLAVTAVLAAAVTTALVLIPGDSRQPVAAPPTAVAPEPHPEPTGTGIPLSEMHIVQGIVDLMAQPRDVNELPRIAHPDQPVEGTLLSTRDDGREAIGVLTDAGRVCLWVWDAPVQTGSATCAPYDVLQQEGIVVDRGGWEVRWYADGSVVWEGI